jgi:transposase
VANSNLTDEQWKIFKPVLAAILAKRPPGRPCENNRQVIEGILWSLQKGHSWRALPGKRYGKWNTVYSRFNRWKKKGVWQEVWAELLKLGFVQQELYPSLEEMLAPGASNAPASK